VILWQLWAFFTPAFDRAHAQLIRWFVLLAAVLMVVGLIFGYFVTLPAAEHFLTNYDNQIYNVQIQARPFISFCVQVLVAMGIVFELPLFVVGLTRLGMIKTDYLRKNRRLCYFVVACIGVALPGVDPVTTTIETVPLALLFEASIWLSVLLDRRSERMRAAAIQA
jgi:sec-independent protein translocase protein TatC